MIYIQVALKKKYLQSLEVAKYVWFILREAGVPNVPPISQIRQMKFGDLNVDDLIMKVQYLFSY